MLLNGGRRVPIFLTVTSPLYVLLVSEYFLRNEDESNADSRQQGCLLLLELDSIRIALMLPVCTAG